jgi:pimeloyl-ACP methyl ester carboxylesterase
VSIRWPSRARDAGPRPGAGRLARNLLCLLAACFGNPAALAGEIVRAEGSLPAGGRWAAERPSNWNGTLLLYSRGYGAPEEVPLAPRGTREWLLTQGYAIAGANYSAPGWALEEAVPDQLATLDLVAQSFGAPRRVIAWGSSMGGLVTVALAERHPDRIDAALTSCGSVGGSVGMMNMALDGAFVFKTLLAPKSDIRLTRIDDDRANGARAQAVLDAAQQTPAGRARIGLAAVLAGLPTWTQPETPRPAPTDHEERQRQAAAAFVMGVFFPRVDQERRAGGIYSWNEGVDYGAQLRASGRMAHVQALYELAGLDLRADLGRLSREPRIKADPTAVSYMTRHYVPSGDLRVPLFSYHEIGDGMTSPSLQSAYSDAVHTAGRQSNLATGWVLAAGHCRFHLTEHAAALRAVEERLDSGRWNVAPAVLNGGKAGSIEAPARFFSPEPPVFLRPFSSRMEK